MRIEWIMYVGIGFLFATVIGLALIPLVHRRAVRLTTGRLHASLPQPMAEIEANKDLLRAEYALSIRQLEKTVEHLKDETTQQLVKLSKKEDAINRLKLERDTLQIKIAALESQVEQTAQSIKAAEHAALQPSLPIGKRSREDIWAGDERLSDAPMPAAGKQSTTDTDTWTRDGLTPDTSIVPAINQEDTWTRAEIAGDPSARRSAADRLATVFSQGDSRKPKSKLH